jgi:hypothetical protein
MGSREPDDPGARLIVGDSTTSENRLCRGDHTHHGASHGRNRRGTHPAAPGSANYHGAVIDGHSLLFCGREGIAGCFHGLNRDV